MGGSIKKEEFFWLIKGFPGCIVDNVEARPALHTHRRRLCTTFSTQETSTTSGKASAQVRDASRNKMTSCFVIRRSIPFKWDLKHPPTRSKWFDFTCGLKLKLAIVGLGWTCNNYYCSWVNFSWEIEMKFCGEEIRLTGQAGQHVGVGWKRLLCSIGIFGLERDGWAALLSMSAVLLEIRYVDKMQIWF